MFKLKSRDIFDRGPVRGWLPWGALAPFLALAFVIATQLAGNVLIAPWTSLDRSGSPTDATSLVVYLLIPFGLLGVLILLWVRFVERRGFASIGLARPDRFKEFARGYAVGIVGILCVVALIGISGGVHPSGAATAWASPSSLFTIGLLLLGFAVQSSVEELLFRGWLLSLLARKFNVGIAVIVSSALFALLHFTRGEPWLVSACDFAFALFACAWALRSRNILGVMGWHAGWNWLLAVGFGVPLTGLDVGIPALLLDLELAGPSWLSGGAEGPEGSVFSLVVLLSGAAWLCWRRRPTTSLQS